MLTRKSFLKTFQNRQERILKLMCIWKQDNRKKGSKFMDRDTHLKVSFTFYMFFIPYPK